MAGAVKTAVAFSLLGPFEAYQVPQLGYAFGGDTGGPMNLGEEYRWNIQTVTFGFDESFLNYFGSQGSNAVYEAFSILNSLPPVSQMSTDLTEFPTDTRRDNFQAAALQLLDVKSTALEFLIEELGLAEPERYVWTLRDRAILPGGSPTNYTVIKRNFDPVTLQPSSFVNGTLYTYSIFDAAPIAIAEAVESQVDPLAFGFTSVASLSVPIGGFYIGLTRDDVGGLRYLYRPNNINTEGLVPGATASSILPPWQPVGSTNTNTVVDIVLRPGVDKITFVPARFDSLLGVFITITNRYNDQFVTNSVLKTQVIERVLTGAPDILFTAEDLGVNAAGFPFTIRRTAAAGANWQNNDAINGQANLAGPGQIQAPGPNITPITITFNKVGPFIINQFGFFLDEFNNVSTGYVWGSFDGSTNLPVVYPIGSSIFDLERQVLGGN